MRTAQVLQAQVLQARSMPTPLGFGARPPVAHYAIGHLLNGVRKHYPDLPGVQGHLQMVEQDLIENAGQFLAAHGAEQVRAFGAWPEKGCV